MFQVNPGESDKRNFDFRFVLNNRNDIENRIRHLNARQKKTGEAIDCDRLARRLNRNKARRLLTAARRCAARAGLRLFQTVDFRDLRVVDSFDLTQFGVG